MLNVNLMPPNLIHDLDYFYWTFFNFGFFSVFNYLNRNSSKTVNSLLFFFCFLFEIYTKFYPNIDLLAIELFKSNTIFRRLKFPVQMHTQTRSIQLQEWSKRVYTSIKTELRFTSSSSNTNCFCVCLIVYRSMYISYIRAL